MDFSTWSDLCQMRVDFSRLYSLQAATMNVQTHSPSNVVAFPGAYRRRTQLTAEFPQSPSPYGKRATALSGEELNARLLILLGICTSSAAIILTAAHILHGS